MRWEAPTRASQFSFVVVTAASLLLGWMTHQALQPPRDSRVSNTNQEIRTAPPAIQESDVLPDALADPFLLSLESREKVEFIATPALLVQDVLIYGTTIGSAQE